MRCPNCGCENEHNAIFCAECGAWVLSSMYEADAPALPEESDRDSEQLRRKLHRFSIGSLCALVALALVMTLWLMLPKTADQPRYIYQQHSQYVYALNDSAVVFHDGSPIAELSFASSEYATVLCTSLDGRTVIIATGENEIAVCRDGVLLQRLSLNAADRTLYLDQKDKALLAACGNAMAYQQGSKLTYFDFSNQTETVLTDACDGQVVISPDGMGVAFTEGNALRYFRDGETKTVSNIPDGFVLLAVSDSGQQIYCYNFTDLSCYSLDGTLSIIGPTPFDFSVSSYWGGSRYPYFNADHSQLIYANDNRTWYSENGQEAVLLYEGQLTPILPAGTALFESNSALTCPAYDLKQMVFSESYSLFSGGLHLPSTDYVERLWYDGQIIAEQSDEPWLDASGSILYYRSMSGDLMRHVLSDNAAQPQQILVGIGDFCIRGDAGMICYVDGGALHICDGEGQNSQQITQLFDVSLFYGQDGTPYYLHGGTLYAIAGGQANSLLLQVTQVSAGAGGMLYVRAGNNLYLSADGGAVISTVKADPKFAVAPCKEAS